MTDIKHLQVRGQPAQAFAEIVKKVAEAAAEGYTVKEGAGFWPTHTGSTFFSDYTVVMELQNKKVDASTPPEKLPAGFVPTVLPPQDEQTESGEKEQTVEVTEPVQEKVKKKAGRPKKNKQ